MIQSFMYANIKTERQYVDSFTLITCLKFVHFGYITHNKVSTALIQAVVNFIVHCWAELMASTANGTKTR